MANEVRFVKCSSEIYELSNKNSDTLYFITDASKLYLGTQLISNQVEFEKACDDIATLTSTTAAQNTRLSLVETTYDNLGELPQIPDGADLNDYTEIGVYGLSSNSYTIANLPPLGLRVTTGGFAGRLTVMAVYGRTADTALYFRQIFEQGVSGGRCWRNFSINTTTGAASFGDWTFDNPNNTVGNASYRYAARTSEFYNGKRIYQLVRNVGALPNAAAVDISGVAYGTDEIVSVMMRVHPLTETAENTGWNFTIRPEVYVIGTQYSGDLGLRIVTTANYSGYAADVIIKYTTISDVT